MECDRYLLTQNPNHPFAWLLKAGVASGGSTLTTLKDINESHPA